MANDANPAYFPYANNMIEEKNQSDQESLLKTIHRVDHGETMVQRIFEMIGHSKFFSDFTREEIERLAVFMQIYRAEVGQTIIQEGDVDDNLLLIVEGRVEIAKTDSHGDRRPMTVVGPGATLGEMSMIDGEPRFATCIAVEETTFAVLSRDSMVRIIIEEPALGSKILIKLVTLLSQRLRATSSNLLQYLEN